MSSGFRLVILLVLLISTSLRAQVAKEHSIAVRAEVSAQPPSITVIWEELHDAQLYAIFKRLYGETKWGPQIMVDVPASRYVDADVEPGKIYEYRINALRSDKTAYGFVTSGINIPARASEGTLLLLVGATAATTCATELEHYIDDVVRVGWNVKMEVVSESATPQEIKALILAAKEAHPDLRSLFLFGRVPIPYSGDIMPDGHEDHRGAWPADVYYGDLDGVWSDNIITSTEGELARNHNIPGDGKFDQSITPSAVELEVGRVDMRNMGWFYVDAATPEEREALLLRNYLNKDHLFRTGGLLHNSKGVVSDVFGRLASNDIPASIAWRGFPTLTVAIDSTSMWMDKLGTDPHLWAYGGGYGTWFAAEKIGTTQDYAQRDPKAIFTMLFGSRFGDWDSDDNLLRAPLGTSTGLASMWAGRPYWYVHQMGMGMTIGEATRHSQSATTSYLPSVADATVQMALMGDPTLRNVEIANEIIGLHRDSNKLSWLVGFNPDAGYFVSRGPTPKGPFSPLTPTMISANNFTDLSPDPSEPYYLVRPVIAPVNKSGSYLQSGRGVIIGPEGSVAGSDAERGILAMQGDALIVNASGNLIVVDMLGRVVLEREVAVGQMINIHQFVRGTYIARLSSSTTAEHLRFIR